MEKGEVLHNFFPQGITNPVSPIQILPTYSIYKQKDTDVYKQKSCLRNLWLSGTELGKVNFVSIIAYNVKLKR
jgi:hypothetical protein